MHYFEERENFESKFKETLDFLSVDLQRKSVARSLRKVLPILVVERLEPRVVLQLECTRLPTEDFFNDEIECFLRFQKIGSNLAAEIVTSLPSLVFVALHAGFYKLAIIFVEHVFWQRALRNHLKLNMRNIDHGIRLPW